MNLLLVSCLLVGLMISSQITRACGYDQTKEKIQSLENLFNMWHAQNMGRIPYEHQLIRKSSAGPLRLRFGKRTLDDRLSEILSERSGPAEFGSDDLPKAV